MSTGASFIDRARDRGHYTWEPTGRLIPASAWTEYRADFAFVASDEGWTTVAAALALLQDPTTG
ncbi:MAG: hypothetical protein ACR2L8_03965 [Solirubrobacteraceae bacterium]